MEVSSEGFVTLSYVVRLRIDHLGVLHGYPTPAEDDWEEPWRYEFVVILGYGDRIINNVIIDRYYGITSSKKDFHELFVNRIWSIEGSPKKVEAVWINKTAKFNTLEELIDYYRSDVKNKTYSVSGILEIRVYNLHDSPIASIKEMDQIKLYAGIRGWSGPGGESGPLWWLLAYDTLDVTDTLKQAFQTPEEVPTTTQVPEETTTALISPEEGYGGRFSDALLVYSMYFHANVSGQTSEGPISRWATSRAEYHMRIKGFSRGNFYVDANAIILQADGSDPDMASVARSAYEGLNISKQTSVSEFSRGMRYFMEYMKERLSNFNIYGVEGTGEFTWYEGIPAVKYTLAGSGTTVLGRDAYNYEVDITSYYETFIGLPLYVNGVIHLYSESGGGRVDIYVVMSIVLEEGLDYFPRQEEIPTATCSLGSGGVARVGLQSLDAEILEVRVDEESDLVLTVSGTGSGSLIVEIEGDDEVDGAWIDGEPADYVVLVKVPGEKTIVMVPVVLSTHLVKISFVSRVAEIGPVGQPGEEIAVGEEEAGGAAEEIGPEVGEEVHAGEGEEPGGGGVTEPIAPPGGFEGLWVFILAAVLIIGAVVGGLLFIRKRKHTKPYPYPPPPPPPPPQY